MSNVRSVVLLALAACSVEETVFIPIDGEPVAEFPVVARRELDLLFVIDDSSLMGDKQLRLANAMQTLVDRLQRAEGGLPDLHVGVVSSDMGTLTSTGVVGPQVDTCRSTGRAGEMLGVPTITGRFLSDIRQPDMSRDINYSGPLVTTLEMMLQLGDLGCTFEQPLAAMQAAFANSANAGFERPGSVLAVYLLSDEDDCSARDPMLFDIEAAELGPLTSFRCTKFGVICDDGAETPDRWDMIGEKLACHSAPPGVLDDNVRYHEFLSERRPADRLVVGAMIGDPAPVQVSVDGAGLTILAPSCTLNGLGGNPVAAAPAVRIHGFLDALSDSAVRSTICTNDANPAMAKFGDRILRALGNPCISRDLVDTDTARPGVQPACSVISAVGSDETPMPTCATGLSPCFEVVEDLELCLVAQQLKVEIRGDLPPEAVIRVSCLVP